MLQNAAMSRAPYCSRVRCILHNAANINIQLEAEEPECDPRPDFFSGSVMTLTPKKSKKVVWPMCGYYTSAIMIGRRSDHITNHFGRTEH